MIINIIGRAHADAALDYGARVGHWTTPDGPAQEIAGTLPFGSPLKQWKHEFARVANPRF